MSQSAEYKNQRWEAEPAVKPEAEPAVKPAVKPAAEPAAELGAVIKAMTLEEKAALLSGKGQWETWNLPRLSIPSLVCSDGPHGVRRQEGAGDHLGLHSSLAATCFPTAATVANSWDEALGEEIGKALGEEAAAQGVNILLGPGLNIKRSPLCGRNFEYFSEDPYLSGKMAAAYIRGIQSRGVAACAKHFAVNSQELRRMAMNAVIDERTLRELYLTGFEIALKEGGAMAVMTSYNQVNGVYANENPHLLKDILRGEWGYQGLVITDWGASNDHVKGVELGSDLEMPNPGLDSARQIVQAVKEGRLEEQAVDRCVGRMLTAIHKLTADRTQGERRDFDHRAHHKLARRAAAESAVLLKNSDGILPLKAGTRVALIGDFAFEPRYQGVGSSLVNPTEIESIRDSVWNSDLQVVGSARGYRRNGKIDKKLEQEALELAAQAEVVIYCFGLDEVSEAEGFDRSHMRLPQNQLHLLEAVSQVNESIVGILSAGSAVEMRWQTRLKAILHGYLYGQAGAGGILDIVTGKVNPSGKLNETYPLRYEDTPAFRYFPGKEKNSEYRESIFVGYRYYETAKAEVQYPFGFGLSYTEFAYSDLSADQRGVSFTLSNKGKTAGSEVVQLYVGLPNSQVFRPEKELKGFRKIHLEPGESRRVEILFDDKTFRYWNVKTGGWEREGGRYRILIGASSADIRLETELEVDKTTEELPYEPGSLPSYDSGKITDVGDEEFSRLLGAPIPDGAWGGDLTVNDAICQMYYAKSRLARGIWHILEHRKKRDEVRGKPDLDFLFVYNMPFRAFAKITRGMVTMEMAEGAVLMANGHFFQGLRQTVRGFFSNLRENRRYARQLMNPEGETETRNGQKRE